MKTLANKPPIRAVPMGLFPTMDSLDEVVSLAETTYTQASGNEIKSLLMTYHNTMLKVLNNGRATLS